MRGDSGEAAARERRWKSAAECDASTGGWGKCSNHDFYEASRGVPGADANTDDITGAVACYTVVSDTER